MKLIRSGLLIFAMLYAAAGWGGEVAIASWNIQKLGLGEQKNYEALARVGGRFDFIAVQEVMSRDGLYGFHAALEKETGERWGKVYSHLIGRGSYQEKYAFIHRLSRVEYLDGALIYLDHQDHFAREPYAARFQTADGANRFVAATIHVLYGRSKADRLPEIQALAEMWQWLEEVFPDDENFVLLGDFNLRPDHPAFSPLLDHARPLITRGATTLSSINRRYANLYDNILVGRSSNLDLISAGIVRFPAEMGWTHEQARRHISDHAPVFVTIRSPGPFPARRLGSSTIAPGPSASPLVALESDGDDRFRGNRNSKIYHHPGCSGYETTAEHNRVPFASEEKARERDFRRARNCDWPAPD